MATPNIPGSLEMKGRPSHKPIEEKLQKHLDKFLYGGGRPSAQKIRDFLNGTWLGEPLHVVLTDVPIGAWTLAMVFDALDSTRTRREFAMAADASEYPETPEPLEYSGWARQR